MGRILKITPVGLMLLLTLSANAQESAKGKQAGQNAQSTKENPQNLAGPDPITRRVKQLADELRSPFCPGKTLMTCTSSQAYDLRRDMEAMARQGKSNDEIIEELKRKYGDDVSNPSQPWYTFFVPFLPFIVLGGLLFWVVRRWRTRGEEYMVGSADMGGDALTDELSFDSGDAAKLDKSDEAQKLAKLRERMWQDD